MKFWRRREFITRAIAWRNEREAVLSAEVQILETLLQASRDDLVEVRNLHGRDLMARFGWEANPEDSSVDWREETERIWLEGEHNLKNKSAAA